ncbi:hypothetical protein PM082_016558 [Marasmius tenuissimus]|nr:hypothetical protein PM082_016558 [Marasmius tenuissimus]
MDPESTTFRIKLHGEAAVITDHDKLVNYIYQYSSDQVKEYIRYIPDFDVEVETKTWTAASTMLKSMFASTDVAVTFTEASLSAYAKTHANDHSFSSQGDVESHYLGFQKIAAPLIKSNNMTDKKRDYYFAQGVPKDLREWFLSKVPKANRVKDNPPKIEAAQRILLGRYARAHFFMKQVTSTRRLQSMTQKGIVLILTRSKPVATKSMTPTSPSTSVDELTKAMEELRLYQLRVEEILACGSSTASQPATQRALNPNHAFAAMDQDGNNDPFCMICGLSANTGLKYQLGPSNCDLTPGLLAEGDMIFDPETNHYLLPSGLNLPRGPCGVGIAGLI